MNAIGALVTCRLCGYRLNDRNITELCLACKYPICNVDMGIYDAISTRDNQIEYLKEELKQKNMQIKRLKNLLHIASDKNEELKEIIESLKNEISCEDPTN